MALSDFTPVIVNTDGAPLLLTTTYQDLYVVPDTEVHEIDVVVYNVTGAAVTFYWRFKTTGNEIGVSIPAGVPYLVIPARVFKGSGTANKIQVRAAANSSLLVTSKANKLL